MYRGKPKPFNKISDFMDRYYRDAKEQGARPASEYRGALRNSARISYRIAKQAYKYQEKNGG